MVLAVPDTDLAGSDGVVEPSQPQSANVVGGE